MFHINAMPINTTDNSQRSASIEQKPRPNSANMCTNNGDILLTSAGSDYKTKRGVLFHTSRKEKQRVILLTSGSRKYH